MTDEKAIQGEANVAKYMALLESESDLKNKLQQFYLKKVEDDKIKNDEIERLQALVLAQEEKLDEQAEQLANQSASSLELEKLSEDLRVTYLKLNQCREVYYEQEARLKKQQEQLKEQLEKVEPEKSTDDLTLIKGVGPKIKDKLLKAGISTFEQIAKWKKEDIEHFEEQLNFKGRVKRDSWVKQAKKFSEK